MCAGRQSEKGVRARSLAFSSFLLPFARVLRVIALASPSLAASPIPRSPFGFGLSSLPYADFTASPQPPPHGCRTFPPIAFFNPLFSRGVMRRGVTHFPATPRRAAQLFLTETEARKRLSDRKPHVAVFHAALPCNV